MLPRVRDVYEFFRRYAQAEDLLRPGTFARNRLELRVDGVGDLPAVLLDIREGCCQVDVQTPFGSGLQTLAYRDVTDILPPDPDVERAHAIVTLRAGSLAMFASASERRPRPAPFRPSELEPDAEPDTAEATVWSPEEVEELLNR